MNIQKMTLNKLRAAPYNPRKDLKPDDPEYKMISDSIEQHGFLQPLVWNKKTGNLVGGHQRLKVLMAKGIKEVEVVVVDVDLKQEKAMNISLNKAVGDWDAERLLELLNQAQEQEWLNMTGFNDDDLTDLLERAKTKIQEEKEFDENIETENECPKCGHRW